MAKFSTEENAAEIQHLKTLVESTIAVHGTAVTNLQTDVVELDDRLVNQAATHGAAITNLQTDVVQLDDRVTTLEGA